MVCSSRLRSLSVMVAAFACTLFFCGRATTIEWLAMNNPLPGSFYHAISAVVDGANVYLVGVGEDGVMVSLVQPLSDPVQSGNWTQVEGPPEVDAEYFYGVHLYNATSWLVTGFVDGDDLAYGFMAFTQDSGASWTVGSDHHVAWLGHLAFLGAGSRYGICLGVGGATNHSFFVTQDGGHSDAAWTSETSSNWFTPPVVMDSSGRFIITGSAMCRSTNFGSTWSCGPPVDEVFDGGISCSTVTSTEAEPAAATAASCTCLTGGGEIDPINSGWVHISSNCAESFNETRALNTPFPVRAVKAVSPSLLIAAGGNIYSNTGGFYHSDNGGLDWTLDATFEAEISECVWVPVTSGNEKKIRAYCAALSHGAGGLYAAEFPNPGL